jgi:hypothetical protein
MLSLPSYKGAFAMRLGAFLTSLLLAGPGHAEPPRPVLVELFTSQGCSSCPPADALLGELAGRPGVFALAWHVDYWDGLGWKDRFSSADATQRQYDFAKRLGLGSVYTPQLVIDGVTETVGSDAGAADAAIKAAAAHPVEGPSLALESGPDGHQRIALGDGPNSTGSVWLIGYDRQQTTPVGRGENAGRSLTEYQVVRRATRLGAWTGAAVSFPLPTKEGEGELVVVEPDSPGPMLAVRDIAR